jgi:anti-anti-sigma factor
MRQTPAWVEVAEEPGTLILRICGELDMGSSETVQRAVLAAIPSAYKVVLDLGDLEFCDSSGLAMFIVAQDKADAAGIEFVLGNIPPAIRHVLATTGVDQRLSIAE